MRAEQEYTIIASLSQSIKTCAKQKEQRVGSTSVFVHSDVQQCPPFKIRRILNREGNIMTPILQASVVIIVDWY